MMMMFVFYMVDEHAGRMGFPCHDHEETRRDLCKVSACCFVPVGRPCTTAQQQEFSVCSGKRDQPAFAQASYSAMSCNGTLSLSFWHGHRLSGRVLTFLYGCVCDRSVPGNGSVASFNRLID